MAERDMTPVKIFLPIVRAYRAEYTDREPVWVGPGDVEAPCWVVIAWGMDAEHPAPPHEPPPAPTQLPASAEPVPPVTVETVVEQPMETVETVEIVEPATEPADVESTTTDTDGQGGENVGIGQIHQWVQKPGQKMTVSRADIATHLHSQFSDFASMLGQDPDPTVGYATDIDLALRRLGVARGDLATATVDDAQEDGAFALSEYYAARRFWRQFSARANIKVDDSQFDYKDVLANVAKIMDDAARNCAALGYDLAPTADIVATPDTVFVDVFPTW